MHILTRRRFRPAASFPRPFACTPVLCLLLAACAAPETRAPAVIEATPAAFSNSGTAPLPDAWWTSFGDSGLDRIMRQALDDNLTLRATWDRLAQARAAARAAGAPLYPSLDVTGGFRRTESGGGSNDVVIPGGGGTGFSGGGSSNRYSVSAAAAYELDLWGGLRSSARAAALDAEASAADVRTAAISLSAEVAQTWYAIAERQARIDLLRAQLAANQQVLRLVNLQFRAGQATGPDILRQRQLVESSQGDLAQARGELAVLRHSLAVLLGRPPGALELGSDPGLVSPPPLPATGVPAELIRRRPDLQSAFLNIRASDERVSAAIADRYPSLTFSLSAETSGAASELFSNWLGTLVSQLALPIIDGGRLSAEVARNRAVLSESLNTYEQSVLDAFREVEDALADERQQRELLASLEAQLDLATSVVEQLRRRFTQGATDYLDVLNALISQQSLERQVLQARFNLVTARIELARALAGGWEVERPAPRMAVLDEDS